MRGVNVSRAERALLIAFAALACVGAARACDATPANRFVASRGAR